MLICHQCGHKIEVYSNITNIRCSNCRATYIAKPLTPLTNSTTIEPQKKKPQNSFISESPYSSSYEKAISYGNAETLPFALSFPKVLFKELGLFDAGFLEKIKSNATPNNYQREIKFKSSQNFSGTVPFFFTKEKTTIGRKSTSSVGFEDVDFKIETHDSSISRRQCFLEIFNSNNLLNILISTHPNASNLIEVNGSYVEKNDKKILYGGEFIRLGNTIYEFIVEKSD